MGGILERKEEFIQARKPFTEFLSLNREGKEGYAQFKAILTQLSPAWGLRPLGYCSCIGPPSPTDLMSKNWILFCLWRGSLKRAPYSQGWELFFKVRNYKNWGLVCSVFVFFFFFDLTVFLFMDILAQLRIEQQNCSHQLNPVQLQHSI